MIGGCIVVVIVESQKDAVVAKSCREESGLKQSPAKMMPLNLLLTQVLREVTTVGAVEGDSDRS